MLSNFDLAGMFSGYFPAMMVMFSIDSLLMRRCSFFSMFGLKSMPVTCLAMAAAGTVLRPVPQPISSVMSSG